MLLAKYQATTTPATPKFAATTTMVRTRSSRPLVTTALSHGGAVLSLVARRWDKRSQIVGSPPGGGSEGTAPACGGAVRECL